MGVPKRSVPPVVLYVSAPVWASALEWSEHQGKSRLAHPRAGGHQLRLAGNAGGIVRQRVVSQAGAAQAIPILWGGDPAGHRYYCGVCDRYHQRGSEFAIVDQQIELTSELKLEVFDAGALGGIVAEIPELCFKVPQRGQGLAQTLVSNNSGLQEVGVDQWLAGSLEFIIGDIEFLVFIQGGGSSRTLTLDRTLAAALLSARDSLKWSPTPPVGVSDSYWEAKPAAV